MEQVWVLSGDIESAISSSELAGEIRKLITDVPAPADIDAIIVVRSPLDLDPSLIRLWCLKSSGDKFPETMCFDISVDLFNSPQSPEVDLMKSDLSGFLKKVEKTLSKYEHLAKKKSATCLRKQSSACDTAKEKNNETN